MGRHSSGKMVLAQHKIYHEEWKTLITLKWKGKEQLTILRDLYCRLTQINSKLLQPIYLFWSNQQNFRVRNRATINFEFVLKTRQRSGKEWFKVLQINWKFGSSSTSEISPNWHVFSILGISISWWYSSANVNLIKKLVLNNLRHQSMYCFYCGFAAERKIKT